jgi:hypothetical protein
MVTVLKMNHDVTPNNLIDGFNISLSTADCSRHLANDISAVYLHQTADNPNIYQLLKSLKADDGLVCSVVM